MILQTASLTGFVIGIAGNEGQWKLRPNECDTVALSAETIDKFHGHKCSVKYVWTVPCDCEQALATLKMICNSFSQNWCKSRF